jgi:hypothetical protein
MALKKIAGYWTYPLFRPIFRRCKRLSNRSLARIMTVRDSTSRYPRSCVARRFVLVLAVISCSGLAYSALEYTQWRNRMIQWDFGAIDRLCGGDTEEERLIDIQFIRQWEYKALKKTEDGTEVWMHWKLSKRHCGNWMLADPMQRSFIRPFKLRFPNGAPHREAFSCVGAPIHENETRNSVLLRSIPRRS